MRQATGYAWMYERMATSAKRWSDGLNILSGALGGVIGTTGIAAIFADTTTPLWQRILSAVVGFLVTLISVLSATWRLDESQMNDVLTQVSYATLGRELMYQLAQPRSDRPDAQEYMKAKLGELEQLKVSAPIIDAAARRAYNRKFQNNPIYSPEDEWGATLADARAQGAPREPGAEPPDPLSMGESEPSYDSGAEADFWTEEGTEASQPDFDTGAPVAARGDPHGGGHAGPSALSLLETLAAALDEARRRPEDSLSEERP